MVWSPDDFFLSRRADSAEVGRLAENLHRLKSKSITGWVMEMIRWKGSSSAFTNLTKLETSTEATQFWMSSFGLLPPRQFSKLLCFLSNVPSLLPASLKGYKGFQRLQHGAARHVGLRTSESSPFPGELGGRIIFLEINFLNIFQILQWSVFCSFLLSSYQNN